MSLLWSYGVIHVAHLMAVFPCSSSIEEQAAYNGLHFNFGSSICTTRQTMS